MECCAGLQLQLADCRILLQYTAALRLYDEGDAASAPTRTNMPQPTATVAWLAAAIKARTSLWSVWSAYSGAAYVYSRRVWACDWATPSGHSTVAIESAYSSAAVHALHCTVHCALGFGLALAHAPQRVAIDRSHVVHTVSTDELVHAAGQQPHGMNALGRHDRHARSYPVPVRRSAVAAPSECLPAVLRTHLLAVRALSRAASVLRCVSIARDG